MGRVALPLGALDDDEGVHIGAAERIDKFLVGLESIKRRGKARRNVLIRTHIVPAILRLRRRRRHLMHHSETRRLKHGRRRDMRIDRAVRQTMF